MAQFPDLSPTDTLGSDDEQIIRQGTTDKRIRSELANTLSWAKREGHIFIGEHTNGITFNSLDEFSFYQGKTYFPKVEVTFPYVSSVADPTLDTNLTDSPTSIFRSTINNIYQIGRPLLTFGDEDPNTLYPWQTWVLVSGDASLALGDGTIQTVTPSGDNTPTVPVPQHSHSSGSLSVNIAHTHNYTDHSPATSTTYAGSGTVQVTGYPPTTPTRTTGGVNEGATKSVTGSTSTTGSAGATLNVRGAQLKVNMWHRTA